MLAYKAAKHDTNHVVITLEIPEDAMTTIHRPNVAVKETAKYRANKAKVLLIEDSEGSTYDTAETDFHSGKKLVYKVGNVVKEPEYDTDIEAVYAEGIHFFLEKRLAQLYGRKPDHGYYENWHDNGQKLMECMFVDGKRNGPFQQWFENGQISKKCMYVNGKEEGLSQLWYENGQTEKEIMYVNGTIHGLVKHWLPNGQRLA